jgi:cytochrome c553
MLTFRHNETKECEIIRRLEANQPEIPVHNHFTFFFYTADIPKNKGFKMKKTLLLAALLGTSVFAADGAALFKKCAACHGINGEKHALGKSKVINKMAPEEIETALNGYKEGTYGGSMKALMKGQIASYDAEQIKAVAEYIGAK